MNIRRLFRARESSWQDEPDDPLVPRLQALGGITADLVARADRNRSVIRAEFIHRTSPPRTPRRGWLSVPRLAPALAASVLLIGLTIGGVAASGAGEPLYGIRLSVEELLLPGDESARLDGQLDRLDRRLDELAGALASGDGRAATAALHAFEQIAAGLSSGTPSDQARHAAAARLAAQVARLEQLIEANPVLDAQALSVARRALLWAGAGRPPRPSGVPGGGSAEPTPAVTVRPAPDASTQPHGPSAPATSTTPTGESVAPRQSAGPSHTNEPRRTGNATTAPGPTHGE